MNNATNLWLYFILVFSVIILPGMDMAFVMGSSMAGGKRSGMAAVGGVVAGGVGHMIIGATGVFAIVALMPAFLNVMLSVGACYIAWMGWSLLRVSNLTVPTVNLKVRSARSVFAGGMATCLLNPKAYLFMLAVFPQFVRVDAGPIWKQAIVLGLITAATQIFVYGGLALLANEVKKSLGARPLAGAWMARGAGLMLLLVAACTLYSGIYWHVRNP